MTSATKLLAKLSKFSDLGLKVARLLIVRCKVKVPLNLAVLGIFKFSRNHKVGIEMTPLHSVPLTPPCGQYAVLLVMDSASHGQMKMKITSRFKS